MKGKRPSTVNSRNLSKLEKVKDIDSFTTLTVKLKNVLVYIVCSSFLIKYLIITFVWEGGGSLVAKMIMN